MNSAKLISFVRASKPAPGARDLSCSAVKRWLPGYLDGALPESVESRLHSRIAQHLSRCGPCRVELTHYQAISRMMSTVSPAEAPDELGVSIRMAVARTRETSGIKAQLARYKTRLELVVEHVVEPLLIPVTGGPLVALMLFGFVFPTLGGGWRLPGVRPDLPLTLMQPARLQPLAGFPLPGLDDAAGDDSSQGLVVEATVNDQGQAVEYRVIGSPLDAGLKRDLDRVVLFSRFRPEMNFGRPTSNGRVVLGFSRILVRG